MNNSEQYRIAPHQAPDFGLGPFIDGYTVPTGRYNPLRLLFNRKGCSSVMVYEQGFVCQEQRTDGTLSLDLHMPFSKIKGIMSRGTNDEAAQKGNDKKPTLQVLGHDSLVRRIYPRLQSSCQAILDAWHTFLHNRLNTELKEQEYCTFVDDEGYELMLATDFIRYNNVLIDTPFAYKQENNLLYIAHDKEGAYTDNDINNGMCRIFLTPNPKIVASSTYPECMIETSFYTPFSHYTASWRCDFLMKNLHISPFLSNFATEMRLWRNW